MKYSCRDEINLLPHCYCAITTMHFSFGASLFENDKSAEQYYSQTFERKNN